MCLVIKCTAYLVMLPIPTKNRLQEHVGVSCGPTKRYGAVTDLTTSVTDLVSMRVVAARRQRSVVTSGVQQQHSCPTRAPCRFIGFNQPCTRCRSLKAVGRIALVISMINAGRPVLPYACLSVYPLFTSTRRQRRQTDCSRRRTCSDC